MLMLYFLRFFIFSSFFQVFDFPGKGEKCPLSPIRTPMSLTVWTLRHWGEADNCVYKTNKTLLHPLQTLWTCLSQLTPKILRSSPFKTCVNELDCFLAGVSAHNNAIVHRPNSDRSQDTRKVLDLITGIPVSLKAFHPMYTVYTDHTFKFKIPHQLQGKCNHPELN